VDAAQPLGLKNGASLTSDSKGAFSADLAAPLVSGQRIQLRVKTTGCTAEDPTGTNNVMSVVGIADWGRVRGTFAAGTVISNDNNFQGQTNSQATLFMDFTVEKNWLWGGVMNNNNQDWRRRWLITTFFETRLTSIPEAQQSTPTAPAATPTPMSAAPRAVSLATGGDNGTNSNTDVNSTFLASRKSALMQAGLYIPFLVTKWKYQNAPNATFLAPLAKVGFITPTGSTTSQTPTGTAAMPVNPAQFYNYYGWGGRIGHYKLTYDDNEAPELISYIDVIFGRFSNLETLAPVTDKSGQTVMVNGVAQSYPIRQYRVGIEGSLKVPATPFLLGFSANIGQNLTLVRHLQAAKDDLRFFFGAKFDIGKLFAKLQQF
jgi:hypothetical protein